MRDFGQLRSFYRTIRKPSESFDQLYVMLKQLYDLPDVVIARMLGVDARQIWLWKTGRAKPRRGNRQFMGVCVLLRLGAIKTANELVKADVILSGGRLESMVAEFLEKEKARRLAREAKKAAKGVPKQDTPTVQPPE